MNSDISLADIEAEAAGYCRDIIAAWLIVSEDGDVRLDTDRVLDKISSMFRRDDGVIIEVSRYHYEASQCLLRFRIGYCEYPRDEDPGPNDWTISINAFVRADEWTECKPQVIALDAWLMNDVEDEGEGFDGREGMLRWFRGERTNLRMTGAIPHDRPL